MKKNNTHQKMGVIFLCPGEDSVAHGYALLPFATLMAQRMTPNASPPLFHAPSIRMKSPIYIGAALFSSSQIPTQTKYPVWNIRGILFGAQERTRTSTGLLPLPPQGSAYTSSATWAHKYPAIITNIGSINQVTACKIALGLVYYHSESQWQHP